MKKLTMAQFLRLDTFNIFTRGQLCGPNPISLVCQQWPCWSGIKHAINGLACQTTSQRVAIHFLDTFVKIETFAPEIEKFEVEKFFENVEKTTLFSIFYFLKSFSGALTRTVRLKKFSKVFPTYLALQ